MNANGVFCVLLGLSEHTESYSINTTPASEDVHNITKCSATSRSAKESCKSVT